jgi:hypothetical protein
MHGDRKHPVDAFRVLAKAGFGDRRRSPLRLLVIMSLIALLLAVSIYLLWPGPERPPLLLASFDEVALPDETISLCARVESLGEVKTGANLAGCQLYFHELQNDRREQLATDRDGRVTVQRSFSSCAVPIEIMVRYPGEGQRPPGNQAKSRVFVWPPETRLLLVDAETALADVDEGSLWTASNLDIRPKPGAVACLRGARAKYRIAYLSTGADRPSRYIKLRAWLERGWAPEQEQFPDGPLLVPACHPPLNVADFLQTKLKDLKERFQGTAVAITAHGEHALLFHEAGWQIFLLSATAEKSDGVIVIPSWHELKGRLP